MRALTIQQPWAWCIAAGHKLVENRSWVTSYRGPLAIHAGKTADVRNLDLVKNMLVELGVVPNLEAKVPHPHLKAYGAVVAVVDLSCLYDMDRAALAAPNLRPALRVDHVMHGVQGAGRHARGRVVVGSCRGLPDREFEAREVVTVLVDVERITPMRSHAQRITASDLQSRGWFRWYAKHHVACSCGWRVDEPTAGGAGYARQVWLEHKAEAISELLTPKHGWLSSSPAMLIGLDPEDEWHRRYRVVLRNRGGAR